MMLEIDDIKLVEQKGSDDCVAACLSMITGEPLESIGMKTPVSDAVCYPWLVRRNILPIRQSDLMSVPFFDGNVYLIGCLSKGTKQPHSIVVKITDDAHVLDPNGEYTNSDINSIPIYSVDRLIYCGDGKIQNPRSLEEAEDMLDAIRKYLGNPLEQ